MKEDVAAPANDTIPHWFKAHWKSDQEEINSVSSGLV
jgi:hypothetical protein